MEEKIKDLLEDIRPLLNQDGGDIEFVRFENGYVFVRLSGACLHCGYQDQTITYGIESYLKNEVPEILGVINVSL